MKNPAKHGQNNGVAGGVLRELLPADALPAAFPISLGGGGGRSCPRFFEAAGRRGFFRENFQNQPGI
jgi:hypothetical protein